MFTCQRKSCSAPDGYEQRSQGCPPSAATLWPHINRWREGAENRDHAVPTRLKVGASARHCACVLPFYKKTELNGRELTVLIDERVLMVGSSCSELSMHSTDSAERCGDSSSRSSRLSATRRLYRADWELAATSGKCMAGVSLGCS